MKNFRNNKGMTMTELLIAVLILVPLFTGVLYTFIKCTQLNELSRHSSMVLWACKNKLADIESTAFNQIYATHNNTTFIANGIDGIGKTYINNTNPQSLVITVAFSWEEANGKKIGEDLDYDGQIDGGEDVNGNGMLDSMVQLSTVIDQF